MSHKQCYEKRKAVDDENIALRLRLESATESIEAAGREIGNLRADLAAFKSHDRCNAGMRSLLNTQEAEIARLRKAANMVIAEWDSRHSGTVGDAIVALRAALRTGGV